MRGSDREGRSNLRGIQSAILLILVVCFSSFPVAHAQTRIDALALNEGEGLLSSAVIDTSGGFAYFGTDTQPGIVVKVRLSDFSRVGALTLNPGEDGLRSAVIDVAGGFAYFGTYTSPGIVVKIRLANLTRVSALTFNAAEGNLTSAVIDASNGFAYFGTDTQPGIVVKVRLSDFSRVGALTLRTYENNLDSAVIDTTNGMAYFGTGPGIIVKVRLSDLSRVGPLALNPGEGPLVSAVIDSTGGYAYFGTDTAPGVIVKVRLSDFTRAQALTVKWGHLLSAVVDAASGFAYFGNTELPGGTVVTIRLSNLTLAGSATGEPQEGEFRSAVIDSANGFAYFGTYIQPAIIVKFSLAVGTNTASTNLPSSATTISASLPGFTIQTQFGTLAMVGGVAVIGIVASVLAIARRRKHAGTIVAPSVVPSAEPSISTGYSELDVMLAGGLPEGYAVVLVSPSYDERDLLVRRVIESSVKSGRPTFHLSSDIARTRDLVNRYDENFYALNPLADKIGLDRSNLFKTPDVGDLSNLNITSTMIIESKVKNEPSKLIIVDLLSDVLLRNKALTTRKWLSDFSARRKAGGFTLLATLDPSISSQEEIRTITGMFDGIIEIYERTLQDRARRFLVIKKMYGRGYSENELMLDKQKLL